MVLFTPNGVIGHENLVHWVEEPTTRVMAMHDILKSIFSNPNGGVADGFTWVRTE